MIHKTIFTFDIETIPDHEAAKNLLGLDESDPKILREKLEEYHKTADGKAIFLKHPFHKIVAISFLEAEIIRENGIEKYKFKTVRSGGKEGSDEAELVSGFFQYLAKTTPRLVSFNGRSFDLAVLKYRAMKHNIAAPFLYKMGDKWNSYTSRYSLDWHCDLLEALCDFGASARIRLNEVCAILGFPGKIDVDGSSVTALYDGGKIGEIRDYCETDVLNTYLVYLNYAHHKGLTDQSSYDNSIAEIKNFLAENSDKEHLAKFLKVWEKDSKKD
jgi:predicted PolB exonuclease-like 3'-5' exonuclease